ncbi:hypothetical protein SAMN05661080_02284 [Modestobacter sp. DSM 44400]|uniref:hypothetical protein n=1 Tax=Modestobacter sp. DSM 44400 TaxID=1550230 RepID=UPI00089CA6DB|nr:hypothetical protein [Modestobacter sp. DSM 44400]SDY08918.1 hypothetical protein SAMN05661080_02284 [Modestobacter sp. DSM 44400]
MPPRSRREHGEPLVVQAARDRERHVSQVTSYGFFAGRGPKRTVTVVPPPLRYWQYDAASPLVVLLTVAALAAWLGFLGWRDGSAAVTDELPLAFGLAALVLLGATGRLTVSDVGVSTDIAGLRQTSSFGIVPRVLVTDVVLGSAPKGWPKPKRRGGWWPGRRRVTVRHLDGDAVTEQAFTVWVRDPAAFADALGHPLP